MLTADDKLLSAHGSLLTAFRGAADATSDLIPIEDCPHEELSQVIHISQIMLARAQEQAEASIQLFLSGHWAAFEALARISLEYSIRFSALMKGDPRVNLGEYLGGHFIEMEKRQRQMRDVLTEAGDERTLRELDVAAENLRCRKELVGGYANFCGFTLTNDRATSTFDHFSALGKRRLYRGLYSVLSSQVHADAESLADYIVIHCVDRTDEERHIAAQEMYHWMAHYLVNLIGAYVEACESFASRFMLVDMSNALNAIRRRVAEIEVDYSAQFREFQRKAVNL